MILCVVFCVSDDQSNNENILFFSLKLLKIEIEKLYRGLPKSCRKGLVKTWKLWWLFCAMVRFVLSWRKDANPPAEKEKSWLFELCILAKLSRILLVNFLHMYNCCAPACRKTKGRNIVVMADCRGEKTRKCDKTLFCRSFVFSNLRIFARTPRKGAVAQLCHHRKQNVQLW